jgi:YjbE family integral membrane protein
MNTITHFPNWPFLFSLLSIVVVDLTLSGDNAVVIAAAAKALPPAMRKRALLAGAAGAVIALVTATFFATRLLHVKFLQVIGGFVILWIALGLFREEPPLESSAAHMSSFWRSMWFILAADVTMSTDNILAIAGIAQGNFSLVLFGLGLSIPLVVFASSVLANLMDRYPAIVYVGAALLGRVAGQMIMTDAFIVQTFAPGNTLRYAVEVAGAVGVLIAGRWLKSRNESLSGPVRSR